MTRQPESISIKEARKIVLLSQKVIPSAPKGKAIDATLEALDHIGYAQIDTISVIQRAHHHTLWNRNPRYQSSHLDKLIQERRAFEYWSHAAAYLPMSDYRYSLPKKQRIKNKEERHWYNRKDSLINEVLDRIKSEGPLMAKDFEGDGRKKTVWEHKPNKQALEYLFMQGDLMISSRKNFHKVYDLTERVLPSSIDTSMPTHKEYARFLIIKYLRANGIGRSTEITYLLKNIKPFVIEALSEMTNSEELFQIVVNGQTYYALPDSLDILNTPLRRSKLKILSPFDNLLIQRKRTKELFDFDYLLECYVPRPKRKYGYFVLPILWNGNLVARMDCKADRKEGVLHIYSIYLENKLKALDGFSHALSKELISFMKFNKCQRIEVHKGVPLGIDSILEEYY